MSKLSVGRITFGPERKLPKEMTLNSITFKTNKPAPVEIIPDWMIIDAIRYSIGRQTTQVETTCSWVVENWFWIHTATKMQIMRDVEKAFKEHAQYAKKTSLLKIHSPLGAKCDIEQWKKVRKLWSKYKNIILKN